MSSHSRATLTGMILIVLSGTFSQAQLLQDPSARSGAVPNGETSLPVGELEFTPATEYVVSDIETNPLAQVPHDQVDGSTSSIDSELSAEAVVTPSDEETAAEEKAKKEQEKKAQEKKEKEKKAKEKKKKLQAAIGAAHKGLFYANDFSYISDPDYNDWWPGDLMKEIPLGCSCMTLDVGGQYRIRQQSERNNRLLGLTGLDDDFLLQRTRLYGNLRFGKRLRIFAEYIDAVSTHEQFGPRPIEENRSDMLNLFADGVLLEGQSSKLLGRIGRQELLYGAQRAVSPLDWANTRLTFDGGKLMWQGSSWDVDGFWTRPLRRNFRQFDSPIQELQFYGIYSTYKGFEKDVLESYWLAFDNDITGARFDSLGGRYLGYSGDWMLEIWGNYQFGRNTNDSSHSAGAWTLGLGRKFNCCWDPTVWVYYDWASGGKRQGGGDGYFHFFPLAHKYLGFMDLFGRRNIETPNVQFSLQPTKKLKLLLWYYYLFLQDKTDTPYTVAMTPFFPGVKPGSADLGYEVDCIASYALNPRMNVLFGYSHFFSGRYYDTPGLPYSGDADFFYTQFQFNF